MKRTYRDGFTLLELLVVIALLGVFTTLGLASYLASQQGSRNARRMADLKVIQAGLEQYFGANSGYPNGCNFGAQQSTYFPQGFPKDPRTRVAYAPASCTTSSYCYCATLEPNTATTGNSTVNNCGNYASGAFFCVQNLQ